MQERFAFPVWLKPASDWAPEETGFVVGCRDVTEVHTQGETVEECLVHAAEALELAIGYRIEIGEDIPVPSRPRAGEHIVALAPLLAAKAALALALRESGVSKSELARRLGVDEKEVRRLLDPRHGSRLPALAAALAALGKRLAIDLRDAA